MPGKLKVLLGVMGVSIILNLATQSWLALAVNVGLLLGILKGNEAVRTLVIGLAWLGLVGSGILFVLGLVGLAALVGEGHLLEGFMLALVTTIMGALGAAQQGFFLWCLRQQDVQHWMFHRSLAM